MEACRVVQTNQFLTFKLGPEVYALDVGNAREILEYGSVTRIPKTPEWIRGVINLRGAVVPVMDLKRKFGMGATERTTAACIIILEVPGDGDLTVMGVLADSVQEVFELDPKQIEPPPKFGARVSTEYLRGMGRRGDTLFIVLDPERVFSDSELQSALDVTDAADTASNAEQPGFEPAPPGSAPRGRTPEIVEVGS